MNAKKLLLFLGFLALTALLGFGIYYLFFRGEEAPPELPPEINANVGVTPLPISPEGAAQVVPTKEPTEPLLPPGVDRYAEGGVTLTTPVVSVPTVGASLSDSGSLNYYNRVDGKFYRMLPNGTLESLSSKVFYNVDKATFDPRGDKAIIEYPDGSNIYYDFATSQQVTLPRHWEEFDFSTAGDKIVAKSVGIDVSNRFLVVANPDGTGARAVQELGNNADKVQVAWSPNNQIIATSRTGESFGTTSQEIYFVGQNHENFKSMVVEGLDFRPNWAPSGEQLVYSAAGELSDYKPMLWIVDAVGDDIGKNRRSLNVNTWADKCTFADDSTLYCAVPDPDQMPRGAGLQPAVVEDVPDSLYKIDLNTGLQTQIAIPEGNHNIQNVMLTPDRKSLYFTDKINGVVNKIELQP